MIDMVNKALNHMCPPAISSMFHIANNENYDLRSNNKTQNPKLTPWKEALAICRLRSGTTELEKQFYHKIEISIIF